MFYRAAGGRAESCATQVAAAVSVHKRGRTVSTCIIIIYNNNYNNNVMRECDFMQQMRRTGVSSVFRSCIHELCPAVTRSESPWFSI